MKQILLFGAGKSATSLIDYLVKAASSKGWLLTVVDQNTELVNSKIGQSPNARALSFNIHETDERRNKIEEADIVISLLPPSLHILVAQDCLHFSKHLLTASYVDSRILNLRNEVADKKILFLCEMGLDPGIDHMSAMELVDRIRGNGGRITSFKSHCGGLVAPESDDNPWHYKISWNPRNVVLAGKDGATYKENGQFKKINYEQLFTVDRKVQVEPYDSLCWYPNRDSVSYAPIYRLEEVDTFIRTTLRHPDFMFGWKNLIDLKLTDESPEYDLVEDLKLAEFFKLHLDKHGFADWLNEKMITRFSQTKQMLEKLMQLMEVEEEAAEEGQEFPDQLMMVDSKGKLNDIHVDDVKENAAALVVHQMHEANLTLKQLFFLGMDDINTIVPKGRYSAADLLQFALEKKLALRQEDKDMVVMLHEVEYELQGKKEIARSSMVVKGQDDIHTAMARTVGLPLGIAAKLILEDKIKLSGLHIPIEPEIYHPVLQELMEHGIAFNEKVDFIGNA